jgi:hypothetical protein
MMFQAKALVLLMASISPALVFCTGANTLARQNTAGTDFVPG